DIARDGLSHLATRLRADHPFLSESHARRLARAYGTRSLRLLGDTRSMADLGRRFGADLTAHEVDYLVSEEWASTADDILWRRSKLGLIFSATERAVLEDYITRQDSPRYDRQNAVHPRA